MSKPPSPKSAPTPLPDPHFAILFEGAWIFTPDADGTRILATCPIDDTMHESQFGIWNDQTNCLDEIPGFGDQNVEPGDSFMVTIQDGGLVSAADGFSDLFGQAATKYPFVYIPGSSGGPQIPAGVRVRQVSIPIPTEVRTAGALMTAEVAGKGTGRLFGLSAVVKRAFVDFIFFYQYENDLTVRICRRRGNVEKCECVRVCSGDANPTPHLIFDIFPTTEGMGSEYPHSRKQDSSGNEMGPPDPSAMMLHASATFDTLRRCLRGADSTSTNSASMSCCDIALYHNQDPMGFDCGDVGLSECELGLARKCKKPGMLNTQLPSCAGGGLVGGGG